MSILGDALKGRFLGAVDLPDHEYPPNAITAKIADLTEENLAREGQPAERKPILHFDPKGDPGELKPMACNKTNAKFLIKHFRTDDESKIIGRTIGIFVDPTVQNAAGQVVGGLRLCAPPNGSGKVTGSAEDANTPQGSADEPSDDIPF